MQLRRSPPLSYSAHLLVRCIRLDYLKARASATKRIFMNVQDDPNAWAVQKFAVGQPVLRTEDPTLVQGRGRYADDVNLPGQAYAIMVRSRHAHGEIKAVDTAKARAMPGVLAVYTGADLAGYGSLKCVPPLKNRDGTPMA